MSSLGIGSLPSLSGTLPSQEEGSAFATPNLSSPSSAAPTVDPGLFQPTPPGPPAASLASLPDLRGPQALPDVSNGYAQNLAYGLPAGEGLSSGPALSNLLGALPEQRPSASPPPVDTDSLVGNRQSYGGSGPQPGGLDIGSNTFDVRSPYPTDFPAPKTVDEAFFRER